MEWLLARPTVIGIAIVGALFSIVAMTLQTRPERSKLARQFTVAAYLFMGTSMLFFILAGLRGANG